MPTDTLHDKGHSNQHAGPPKPPLVLHVGAIGHRPDPDKRPTPDVPALRLTIAKILRQIQEAFEGVAAAKGEFFSLGGTGCRGGFLRIISSLAEGADQWVADEALRLGYELQAPMPFRIEEYAKDFTDQALLEFHRLKDQATAILELDGCRARESESYEAAGRAVIVQSDLVIALWDGAEEKGRGGTGQMVRESLRNGVPVIWIKWAGPEQWQLLDRLQWRVLLDIDDLKGELARLTTLVTDILLPPDLDMARRQADRPNERERYYREAQRRWIVLGSAWELLRRLVLLRPLQWPWRLRPYEAAAAEEWNEDWSHSAGLDRNLVGRIDKPYLSHYAWANQSALFYGGRHRSSTALNYILSTLAVLCALLGIPSLVHKHRDVAANLGELVLIGFIIFITVRGAMGRWHERWIQYRILAERLRTARFLDLLGGGRQHFTIPGHLGTYGNPANSWVYWHYRAVARAAGLPNSRFDGACLAAIQATCRDILIQGQIDYHAENARDLSTIDHRLHWLAIGLFVTTFVVSVVNLGLLSAMETVPAQAGILLVTLNALLPAFGAAIAAIRSQGEFHRIAQRSLAMREELDELKLGLSQIAPRGDELKSQEMRRIVEQAARLMINETLDWRIVFQDRPLVLPA